MTTIRWKASPVWHETAMHERGRPILVAESPGQLLVRLKGTRQVLGIPWTLVYLRAAQMQAQQVRMEKVKARKARRHEGTKARSDRVFGVRVFQDPKRNRGKTILSREGDGGRT
jgi:hypothetical protein